MQSLKELFKIGNGPSSSHTMGPKKATLYFISKYPNMDKYEVILYGSLALTGKGHLTDKIIHDTLSSYNHEVIFDYKNDDIKHPNTMDFIAYKDNKIVNKMRIYSVGGGTINIEGEEMADNVCVYPLDSLDEIKKYCTLNNLSLSDYVYLVEGNDIIEHLMNIYDAMVNSINEGLKKEGVLPGKLQTKRKAKAIYEASKEDRSLLVSAYAYAVNEENASGGIIVTAPTCGASGVVPACLKYLIDLGYKKDKLIDGLAVAGLIGNIVKKNASISGAECGCQAEVGTATSMAAAMIASVFGYNNDSIEHAAEIAMEHQLGLTCDPIDGYVQIPCIERNAIAAERAIHAAKLAKILVGTQKVSFDIVVETMRETGKDLNNSYRETSEGGLAKKYRY